MKQFNQFVVKFDDYLLYLFVLLLPIFPYSDVLFVTVSVLTILFIKVIKIILTKKLEFNSGIYDIPILILSAIYLLSTLFFAPERYSSIINPATTSVIILGAIIYFLINQLDAGAKKNLIYFILAGSVLYSIKLLLTSAKVLNFAGPQSDYILLTLYLFITLPIMVIEIIKQKEFIYKFLFAISIFITVFTIIVSIITSPKPEFLSFKNSVSITSEVLKQKLFIGVGSSNYIEAFNKFRPFEYNLTKNWSLKFSQSSSFLLTILTETGLLGISAFLAIFAIYINALINKPLKLMPTLFAFLGLILFPASTISIVSLFLLLGAYSENKKQEHNLSSNLIGAIISLPMIILLILLSYKIYNLAFAEYAYTKGLESLTQNKAKDSYDLIKKSIALNPKIDRYHRAMSSVNFGIANALSKQSETTESQKEQATVFIQESINEAKAAVAINNKSAENWEFLGRTYHLLIPFTKGADIFALQSYKEAIALDPINPNLRIRLGEVFMIQKDYKNAIEAFKLAVLAKEDHPNTHFNLGLAYKENNEIENAKAEFKKSIQFINEENTKDFELAKKELESLNTTTQN